MCDECCATEPEDGDYVISSCGYLGSGTQVSVVGDKGAAVFKDEEEAEDYVRSRMEGERFYPNVWFLSDHGNLEIRKGL